MLQELKVSQFAIIDSLQIEFQKGLNILSGETGSGKSVLLKSLALLMGDKASSDTVRVGATQATVEGAFNLKNRADLEKKLTDLGIPVDDHQLIVRRTISTEDKSKIYLNGVLSPLSQLRELISPLIAVTSHQAPLIEMTGQHDNRNLLSKSYHLDLLDQYASLSDLRIAYENTYSQWIHLKSEIQSFEKKAQEKNQRLDFIKYQVSEFKNLNLNPEVDENLEQEIKSLKNSSKLIQFSELCSEVIYEDQDSVSSRLKSLLKKSHEFAQLDQELYEKTQGLEQALNLIDETIFAIQSYVKKLNLDPEVLDEKESRLSQIRKLQKKHGQDLHAMIQLFDSLQKELHELENSDSHLIEMQKKCHALELELQKKAIELHQHRTQAAKKLTLLVNEELEDLNMKGVTFHIQASLLQQLSSTGLSDIEFLSKTSPKDPERPLGKVSSGGELSRILLALKKSVSQTTTKTHELPRTYLFDEVDTGVSGPTAEKVGKKLKEIARFQQVICVTHLPQVAAFADAHYTIHKKTVKQQAVMNVELLDSKSRIEEIARLISGEKISKTSLAHAEQLIKEVQP